ncbi:MAG TPA: cytidylate kinase-like family protein [Eubacteriales bacterium]|nr:cytidylate kinase-like family protein [Clostridia bacterium]HRV73325.1 cytidylate kinase-like family protein [Eubacteriales bacterium]
MSRVITISREFGSGGRELGKRLAENLGIAYYDNEIVQEIAKRTDLAEAYVHQILEEKPTAVFPITIGRSLYSMSSQPVLQNSQVYAEQHKIITEMAQKSDCVIVGRCADYILRDMNPLRLFVYASTESKIARCRGRESDREHLTEKALRSQMNTIDKRRAGYYQFFTGNKWGDMQNYDLCINTSNVQIKLVAAAISEAIRRKDI